MALGMVMQLPEEADETSISKRQLLAKLDVCMGGRVAEELIFGESDITTGASSDIEQACISAWQQTGKLERLCLLCVPCTGLHCAGVVSAVVQCQGEVHNWCEEAATSRYGPCVERLCSVLLQATKLARAMVTKYGMSTSLGPTSIAYEDNGRSLSSETRAAVESEVWPNHSVLSPSSWDC